MSSSISPQVVTRRWYALAQRHRRMADRLLRAGFADGALFHTYHAYECVVSAVLSSLGLRVPPNHARRIELFVQHRDTAKPYDTTERALRELNMQLRNQSLYYDEVEDLLPSERFSLALVADLLALAHQFAWEVWQEIR